MTRAHVRLLGPCFKTGRTGDRPIRHRPRANSGEPASVDARTQSQGTENSPPQSNARARERGPKPAAPLAGRVLLGPPTGHTAHRVYNTGPARDRPPSPGDSDRRQTGRGAPPAESASVAKRRPPSLAPERCVFWLARPDGQRTEFDGRTLRSSPFASKRFHVLLNSLFKVLFNFPSRYLFAIGLVSVFSLRWSLPPTLGCILKQPDSEDAPSRATDGRRGLTPALGEAPIRRTRTIDRPSRVVPNATVPDATTAWDSALGYSRFTRRY